MGILFSFLHVRADGLRAALGAAQCGQRAGVRAGAAEPLGSPLCTPPTPAPITLNHSQVSYICNHKKDVWEIEFKTP